MNYFLDLRATEGRHDPRLLAETLFPLVWRRDYSAPGFALVDLGTTTTSTALRSLMVELKREFSAICRTQAGNDLIYQSMGRFDQQNTTRFHRDNAPEESLLMLGYEPTPVPSRLLMADYSRCAHDLGITPADFLRDHNPMYQRGEEALSRYATVLDPFRAEHFQIVLINNSAAPWSSEGFRSQGVLHKAEILAPDATQSRIVNSTMLAAAPIGAHDLVDRAGQTEFASTAVVSQRNY